MGNDAPTYGDAAVPAGRHLTASLVGPCYDGASLSHRLGISEDALGERANAHVLLACRTRSGQWCYPALQFDGHGRTLPRLREVLELLLAGADDDRRWRAARWLAAPAPYLPGTVSAAQWLRDGGDPELVVAAARADARRWAA